MVILVQSKHTVLIPLVGSLGARKSGWVLSVLVAPLHSWAFHIRARIVCCLLHLPPLRISPRVGGAVEGLAVV